MPSTDESFGERLEAGLGRATDHLPLAVVPLLASLLSVDNVRRVLDFRGVHLGIAFPLPPAVPDLWTFVNVPNQGSGVHVSPTLPLLPVLVVVQAALAAGLLGSVHQVLRKGTYDFSRNAKRYFVPFLAYQALVGVALLATVALGAVAPPLLLLAIPAYLVFAYLFYAAPYLLVVEDLGVVAALARSYGWALAGGAYARFAGGYLLAVAGISVVATAVVVNAGAVGIAVGTIAGAPVALAFAFATTRFVADMAADGDDPEPNDRGDPVGWG